MTGISLLVAPVERERPAALPHEARTPVVTAPLSPRWATVAVAALGSVEVEGAPKEGSSPLAEASGAQGPERLGGLARCLLPIGV